MVRERVSVVGVRAWDAKESERVRARVGIRENNLIQNPREEYNRGKSDKQVVRNRIDDILILYKPLLYHLGNIQDIFTKYSPAYKAHTSLWWMQTLFITYTHDEQ